VGAEKGINYHLSPLCYFVPYFVILCGSMNYVLPQKYTNVITKVSKGFLRQSLPP